MWKTVMTGLTVCVAASASVAQIMRPDPTWEINSLPGEARFEVVEGLQGGDMRIWCEAGRYAVRQLGAGATERLFVETPRGVARTAVGYGVGFTTAPDAALVANAARPGDGGDYSLQLDRPGFNISVGNALGLCSYEMDW